MLKGDTEFMISFFQLTVQRPDCRKQSIKLFKMLKII